MFYLLKIHAQIRDFVVLSMVTSDWMRIGAFFFDLPVAFLTEKLIPPVKRPQEETTEKMLPLRGSCTLNNIKTGIWIAGISKLMLQPCQLLREDLKFYNQFI